MFYLPDYEKIYSKSCADPFMAKEYKCNDEESKWLSQGLGPGDFCTMTKPDFKHVVRSAKTWFVDCGV